MSVTNCGICGKEMATVCSSCHEKDVENLHAEIKALEKRLERLAELTGHEV